MTNSDSTDGSRVMNSQRDQSDQSDQRDKSEWKLTDVYYRHPQSNRDALRNVSLEIASGQITAVIGPNGAGKSTLMSILLGTISPTRGSAWFRDEKVHAWPRRALAMEIAVVPQGEAEPLYTVRDAVAMGRYPHLGPWKREGHDDTAAIMRAMERCDIQEFSKRYITTLSGGERQRVRVARALAQQTKVIVLDEPTASLDIRHEMVMFEQVHHERLSGATVVIVTHNLNLAARYADTIVMLNNGEIVASGKPMDVLTTNSVESVYEWPVDVHLHSDGSPQIVPKTRLMAGKPS